MLQEAIAVVVLLQEILLHEISVVAIAMADLVVVAEALVVEEDNL